MASMDWQQEKERLQKLYSGMSDGELAKVSADPGSLTDVARGVLGEILLLRGLPSLEVVTEQQFEHKQREQALKPTLIRRYLDLPEANIAQSVLESAGIESFLADENMVRLDWFYSNLVGGIKLLVHEEDVEAATKLLDQTTPDKFSVDGVGDYEQPHCPQCGSMNTSLDGLHKPLTFGAMYITSLPIPVIRKGWKCHECGHAWADSPSSEALNP